MRKYRREDIIELFRQAEEEGFAIPAFNYSDYWDMTAIVEAAEEERSPVMLMADPPVYETISPKMCAAMGDVLTERAAVPVIHHLDHSAHRSICREAVELGFPSVMMDASDKPVEENISYVKEIAEYAHERHGIVEAEIGRIRGISDYETSYTGEDYLFDLDEAVRLVKEGAPDLLAIGIGNAHGFYVGKPELNFRKLAEAKEAIDIPLVLHGGTGIPAADIRRAIQGGIRKINVGTAIYTSYMNGIREQLMKGGENQFTLEVMRHGVEQVKAVVKEWIHMCMSEHRV